VLAQVILQGPLKWLGGVAPVLRATAVLCCMCPVDTCTSPDRNKSTLKYTSMILCTVVALQAAAWGFGVASVVRGSTDSSTDHSTILPRDAGLV
jgi:hypothetical protein